MGCGAGYFGLLTAPSATVQPNLPAPIALHFAGSWPDGKDTNEAAGRGSCSLVVVLLEKEIEDGCVLAQDPQKSGPAVADIDSTQIAAADLDEATVCGADVDGAAVQHADVGESHVARADVGDA